VTIILAELFHTAHVPAKQVRIVIDREPQVLDDIEQSEGVIASVITTPAFRNISRVQL
jgi:hypothetical protein